TSRPSSAGHWSTLAALIMKVACWQRPRMGFFGSMMIPVGAGAAASCHSDETSHGPRCGNGSFPFHGRQYIMPQILCALWSEMSFLTPVFQLFQERLQDRL